MEVAGTDAGGRLVLAGGLTFTSRESLDEAIGITTLTGARI